jgi:putative ABC transport system substrate-binding protein
MMRRRDFITGMAGSAATWPLAAHAQQPAMPVIGLLNNTSPDAFAERLRGLHRGLKEAGFVERENVAIEYRWAENQMDQLPALAAELVRQQVAVIAATGGPATAFAAKGATQNVPIVFIVAEDPVRLGLVASLARPGGNLTGINIFTAELVAKRVAVLVNPINAAITETTLRDVEPAARAIGMQIQVLNASNSREVDAAFATLASERPDALFVAGDPFLNSRRVHLTQLAAFHRLPATYALRDYAEAGGLMSYGPNIADAFRQIGAYAGRILKGAKPADLPVVQASKFELVINTQTARMLDLTVPPMLLARADGVIE